MKIFVVLTDMMGGPHFVGADRSMAAALEREASCNQGANKRVIEIDVIGELSDPNVVYIAERLERSLDVFHFDGVYGNYEAAARSAGDKRNALRYELNR